VEQLTADDIKAIIQEIKKIIDSNKDTLTELDSRMGDGDLGITMTKAFTAAHEESGKSEEKIPGKLLMRLGMIIAKTAPSTMGTLIATGFMKGGKAIEQAGEIGTEELAVFFENFVRSIMERGKTVPGNKTIIDTLYPASLALREEADKHHPLDLAIRTAYTATLTGLEASTHMKAQHGRAAYYQDKSIGMQDAGATAGTYIMEGFYDYIAAGKH
jgi:dihydroxyacetone kinase-like protein